MGAIMARATDGGSKQRPPVKTLRALLARTMAGKTADALDAVVGAVRAAAGDCSLAAATAREAMREALDLSLPADAGGGGSSSVETLKSELSAVGVPPAVLAAAFDSQGGGLRAWAEVDAALVALHVGLMLSLEELGKLGHSPFCANAVFIKGCMHLGGCILCCRTHAFWHCACCHVCCMPF